MNARAVRRQSYYRNPQQKVRARENMRQRRVANPLGMRTRETRSKLATAYGLTQEEYEKLFAKQAARCAICADKIVSRFDEKRPTWVGAGAPANDIARVDHCHLTNAVRGLLCSNCNILLGKAKDSEKLLLNAVRYLRESATAQVQPAAERESVSEIGPGSRDPESSVRRGSRREQLSPF